LANTVFGPILPGVIDNFEFDFTSQIGPSGSISSVTWACEATQGTDPDATSRLVGAPSFSQFKTTSLVGDMVDEVVYSLTATAAISDGRVLIQIGEVLCSSQPPEPMPKPTSPGWVQFDYDQFVGKYPEFADRTVEQLQDFFDATGDLHRNDGNGPVQDPVQQLRLMYLLMAHLIKLSSLSSGTNMVGPITSESVGPLSASTKGFEGLPGTQQWYVQTQYGATYWAATAAYRGLRYRPGPTRVFDLNPLRW
jgi:hypothetical protein